ncbi:hypothetical protein L861_15980 [Litchfieldella anticariensis FP35 = DSM 16096]|uniref:TonB-denpendent receptor n=1 Tax=Litchfieldella anticariensis (strain DSM 16096 / CECT 5854 / CIP 108499 / LMG 22089 / FP35) TaxID=1121939 RepID=S2KJ75_LITA3|nr:TonB-dependent receptor [Halomonas anticariensis]EPC02207.1 hypothetical protein L861_15980 [Halomonas anticariensis FP35 = DSM 16096]
MSHPRQPNVTWLIPAVLSALPSAALAQSATEQDTANELSPVVVTATRNKSVAGETPQKVTVISREQIEQQLAITSDRGQVLSNLIPSYSPSRQKMTNSGETFRGRDPLFMIDGIPQSNPLRDSSRDSYTIDLAMVERIEVIHGASAEHGLGATGGIINFVTKSAEPGEVNQHASASLTFDDELDSEGLGHKLSYLINGQQGKWDYLAAVTQQERGIFRDGEGRNIGIDGTQGEIQDSTSYDIFTKLGYWLDDNQNLEFSLNHFKLDNNGDYIAVEGNRATGEPTTSRKGDPEGDPAYNEATTTGLSYSHADWFGNELDAKLYYQRFRAQFGGSVIPTFQDPSIAPDGTLFDQSRNESDKLGAKFTINRSGMFNDRLNLTTGLDLIQDETQQLLVQTGRTYVPETQFRNYAVFLQGDYELIDDLTLHAGIRQEYAKLNVDTYQTIASQNGVTVEGGSPDFDETLHNFGAVYQVTDWAQLFANYSEGFGMPDVGRVLRGIDATGQDVDTLLELQPIVTDNREIGTRFGWDRYNFELSYYESDSDFGQRLTEEGGTFVANREKVEIQGVELSGEIQLTDDHGLRLSYARTRGKSDTDGDGDVDTELTGINIAPERLTVGWSASWTDKLATHLQASHFFSDTFEDQEDPDLHHFDGYSLVDASLAYRLPVGQMSVGIENLLDKDYFTYYSQTARGGDDQYFQGRGRTFTVGYQLDF